MARPAVDARRLVRWGVPTVLVLAVVAFFGVRAVSASGAETDRYATATVTRGSVSSTYAGSGTVEKTDSASATFPATGTVTRVDVEVGSRVEAGDELAEMDGTALAMAVTTAKQTLADAQVALEKAQDAADAEAGASASPSATSTPSAAPTPKASASVPARASTPARTSGSRPSGGSSAAPSPSTGSAPGAGHDLAALSRRVTEAQARLATLTADASADLVAQQDRCAALSTGGTTVTPSPTPSATASPTARPTPTASPTATASPTPTGTVSPSGSARPGATAPATAGATPVGSTDPQTLTGCIAAVVKVQQDQVGRTNAQTELDVAVKALLTAVQGQGSGSSGSGSTGGSGSSGGQAGGTQPGGTTSGGTRSGSTQSGSTQSGGTQSGGGSTPRSSGGSTSASTGGTSGRSGAGSGGQPDLTVGAAEAAVTKAQLALDTAEAKREAATMTAPISGVVSAVPFAKGDTASTTDAVVVIGKGAVSVEMSVPETAFRTLKAGQPASLTTPGGGQATGTVTRIGLLPTSSTTGTTSTTAGSAATTWPVEVSASGQAAATLPAGATASVTVRLRTSTDVLVVPVSAVTRSGTTGTVRVLDQGRVTPRTVPLGAVGAATVEVTDGLTEGQRLVIADNTTALPTTSSTRRAGSFAGAGGFGAAPPGGR